MLISIEIILLAVTLIVLISSYTSDDILAQTYSIYIIDIDRSWFDYDIGIGIIVAYYRLRGSISLNS